MDARHHGETQGCRPDPRERYSAITVMPIREYLGMPAEEGSVGPVILLSSYPEPAMPQGTDYLFITADDVTNPKRKGAFKMHQAQAIARFVESRGADDRLFVCCDGGVSRSAAVAAAISYAMTGADDVIWADPRFRPNPLVYALTREALGLPCEEDSLRARTACNEDALKRKIEGGRRG